MKEQYMRNEIYEQIMAHVTINVKRILYKYLVRVKFEIQDRINSSNREQEK